MRVILEQAIRRLKIFTTLKNKMPNASLDIFDDTGKKR